LTSLGLFNFGAFLRVAELLNGGVDATKPNDCVMSENWCACTHFGQYRVRDGSSQSLKGYQITVTDLFESDISSDRGYLAQAELPRVGVFVYW
jgi:hypothetical protein